MDHKQETAGTTVEIHDSSYTTAVSDSLELVELLHFTRHSHFQLYQKLPMVVLLNQQELLSLNKISTIDITTMAGAVDALKVVDRALDRVHMERAKFGALMSRMNVVIDNLTTISQSQRASKSRILDADFAKESSRLSKSQILQQSAMNMIAQASRTMQNVLVLFQ